MHPFACLRFRQLDWRFLLVEDHPFNMVGCQLQTQNGGFDIISDNLNPGSVCGSLQVVFVGCLQIGVRIVGRLFGAVGAVREVNLSEDQFLARFRQKV